MLGLGDSNAFIILIGSNLDVTLNDNLVQPNFAKIGIKAYDSALVRKVILYLVS